MNAPRRACVGRMVSDRFGELRRQYWRVHRALGGVWPDDLRLVSCLVHTGEPLERSERPLTKADEDEGEGLLREASN